jgi:hypothetical protein
MRVVTFVVVRIITNLFFFEFARSRPPVRPSIHPTTIDELTTDFLLMMEN